MKVRVAMIAWLAILKYIVKIWSGLEVDCFIHFEEIGHSTEYYNGGSKSIV